jgi:hypothetical protein
VFKGSRYRSPKVAQRFAAFGPERQSPVSNPNLCLAASQVEMLHGAECHVFVFLTMICAMHAAWLAGMSRKSFGEKFRPGIAPGRPLQSWLLIPIPGYVVSPR